jgi:hypothetical protein
MPGARKEDLAALARFLDREAERWEKVRVVREALSRIQSLARAEADAQAALEAAQADLAWVKAQAAEIEALLPQARDAARRKIEALRRETDLELRNERLRRAEEERRLDAQIARKRALLQRLTQQIEAVWARLSAMPPRA